MLSISRRSMMMGKKKLSKIIASGTENPDSSMGAYAMNPRDYDQFLPMLDPMIRDFHNIAEAVEIAQEHDWDTTRKTCDLGAIDAQLKDVSMRVRVARNVATFPLPGAMSKEQRVEFETLAADAFAKTGNKSGIRWENISQLLPVHPMKSVKMSIARG